jgi:plasmid stabilization system protein ParE
VQNTGYEVVASAHAEADIDEITGYIAVALGNKKAAKDILEKLRRQYETVAGNPYLYPLSRDPVLRAKGYRWFSVGNHMALYTVDEQAKEVHIARVVYGRRNLESLL